MHCCIHVGNVVKFMSNFDSLFTMSSRQNLSEQKRKHLTFWQTCKCTLSKAVGDTWNLIGFHCFAEIIRKYAAFAFSVDLCCVCVFSNVYQDFGQISSLHFYATELIFMTDFLSLRTKLFQKYCSDQNKTLNLFKKCRKSHTFTPCIAITAEVRVFYNKF